MESSLRDGPRPAIIVAVIGVCTHRLFSRLPALNSGHCIYMLHTETANKRGADLNNVSSNSVLARCDVPSLLLPIYTLSSGNCRFQAMNSYIASRKTFPLFQVFQVKIDSSTRVENVSSTTFAIQTPTRIKMLEK